MSVTAVVINYQTPDLLEKAVRSFHHFYPEVPILLVDNGSRDRSRDLIAELARELEPATEPLFVEENIYHGPAMHLALESVSTPHVFILDSDTETERGGFLEPMEDLLEKSERTYGVGHVVHVNQRGFAVSAGIPVLQSAYMLIKRSIYFQLPPFIHHGLPVLNNFKAAAAEGYHVEDFPVQDYVKHLGRGTAERYGYGLGLRSRLDYVLNKLGL